MKTTNFATALLVAMCCLGGVFHVAARPGQLRFNLPAGHEGDHLVHDGGSRVINGVRMVTDEVVYRLDLPFDAQRAEARVSCKGPYVIELYFPHNAGYPQIFKPARSFRDADEPVDEYRSERVFLTSEMWALNRYNFRGRRPHHGEHSGMTTAYIRIRVHPLHPDEGPVKVKRVLVLSGRGSAPVEEKTWQDPIDAGPAARLQLEEVSVTRDDSIESYRLRELIDSVPSGRQTLGGRVLEVPQKSRRNLRVGPGETSAEIPLEGCATSVNLLMWLGDAAKDEGVGQAEFLYADGSASRLWLRESYNMANYRRHMRGMLYSYFGPADLPAGSVAWRAREDPRSEIPLAGDMKTPFTGLYALTWHNPHPGKQLRGLRIVNRSRRASLGLVAAGSVNKPLRLLLLPETFRVEAGRPIRARVLIENRTNRARDVKVGARLALGDTTFGEWSGRATVPASSSAMVPVEIGAAPQRDTRAFLAVKAAGADDATVELAVLTPETNRAHVRRKPGISVFLPHANDSTLMQVYKCGWNQIRLYPWWSDWNPAPGEYDWSAIDATVNGCADYGIGVWLAQGHIGENHYPDYVSHTDRNNLGNETRHACIWDEGYLQPMEEAFGALIRRYADNPAVEMWELYLTDNDGVFEHKTVDGKTALGGFGPHAQAAWRIYLRDTLGISLQQVRRWTGRDLGSWADVRLPAHKKGVPEAYYAHFLDFRFRGVAEARRRQLEVVQKNDDDTPALMMSGGPSAYIGYNNGDHIGAYIPLLDEYDGCQRVGACNTMDKWLSWGQWASDRDLMLHGEVASVPPLSVDAPKAANHCALFGATSASYCGYRMGYFLHNWARYLPYMARPLDAERLYDPVAAFFSVETMRNLLIIENNEVMELGRHTFERGAKGFHVTNLSYHLQADRDETWDRAPIMFDMMSRDLGDDARRRLIDFCRNGGIFVADTVTDDRAGYRFFEDAGIELTDSDDETARFAAGPAFSCPEGSFRIVKTSGADTMASSEHGPVLVAKPLGQGAIVVAGFPLHLHRNVPLMKQVHRRVLARKDVTPLIQTEAPWSEWRAFRTDEGFLLVGLNNHFREKDIALRLRLPWEASAYRVRDVYRGTALGDISVTDGQLSCTATLEALSPAYITLKPRR